MRLNAAQVLDIDTWMSPRYCDTSIIRPFSCFPNVYTVYPRELYPVGRTVYPRELYPVFREDFGYSVKSGGKGALA